MVRSDEIFPNSWVVFCSSRVGIDVELFENVAKSRTPTNFNRLDTMVLRFIEFDPLTLIAIRLLDNFVNHN